LGAFRRFVAATFTWTLGLSAFCMTVGGIIAAVIFMAADLIPFAAPCAVLAAAGLATLGWLISAANQRNLSRKQHTLNLLMQMRHSEFYNKQLGAINALSVGPSPAAPHLIALLTRAAAPTNDEQTAFARGAIYILNYWEFVCAAMVVGDLDPELVRRTVRQHIVGYHDKFAALIDHERQTGDALVYRHLRAVADDWRSTNPLPDDAKTPAGGAAGVSDGVGT